MDLQTMIDDFTDRWAPSRFKGRSEFVCQLRALLEAYGKAALEHESLPDTGNEQRDPL